MTITQANMVTTIKRQYKRQDKDDDIKTAIQFIVDDIVDDFENNRSLKDNESSPLALTSGVATLDISSYLSSLYGNYIEKVVLIDSDDENNNSELIEISFSDYLSWLPDPTSPEDYQQDYPKYYARREDVLYFKPVPEYSTLSVQLYWRKYHPIISASQDILLPANFERCIMQGSLWQIYEFVEEKRGLSSRHKNNYEMTKLKLIKRYNNKPNLPMFMEYNDLSSPGYGRRN